MSTDLTTLEKLRHFDPENAASPSDDSARDRLLDRLVADDFDSPALLHVVTASRRPTLKVTLGLTAAVAAGAACLLLAAPMTSTPHSDFAAGHHFSLASWTKTPTPAAATDTDRDACATALFHEPFDDTRMHSYGVDHRGDFTSLLMTRGGAPLLCILHAGAIVGDGRMLAVHAMTELSTGDPAGATIEQLGLVMIPDPAEEGEHAGMTVAVGSAAADVTSVVLRTPDGRDVDATVSEGSWTAWYPDFGVPIPMDSPFALSEAAKLAPTTAIPTATYTTTDGSVHAVPVPASFVLTEADTAGGGGWSGDAGR